MASSSSPINYAEPTVRRPTSHRSGSIFSCLSIVLLIFLCLHIILKIASSTNTLLGLLFMSLALIPTFVFAPLILKSFRDPAVPDRFLLLQFLLSAVPLIFLIIPLEIAFTIISVLPLLLFYHEEILTELKGIGDAVSANKGLEDDPDAFLVLVTEASQRILRSIPFWAIVITLIAVAVLSAGTTEELGKWLVSRRYKSIEHEALISGTPRISARGILASACMSGLGFATIENIGYAMSIGSVATGGWFGTAGLVFLALFRGALAYVIHIGTQLYVAVTAAQNHLFHDGGRLETALLKVILFHGLFDAIAFVSMAGALAKKIPQWTTLLVPVFDVGLAVFLGLLVRSRYRALLEREHALGSNESQV